MTAPERVEIDTSELRLEAQKRMREIDGALLRNAADEIDALRLSLRSAEDELSVLRAEDARHIERETSYSHREEALRGLLKEWLLVAGWTDKPGRLIERTEATLGENRIAPGA